MITKLSTNDVLERLAGFERAYAVMTGEQLSSDEFYERFTAGDFDNRFGARWATFYEAAQLARANDAPTRPKGIWKAATSTGLVVEGEDLGQVVESLERARLNERKA